MRYNLCLLVSNNGIIVMNNPEGDGINVTVSTDQASGVDESENRFIQFLKPLTDRTDMFLKIVQTNGSAALRNERFKNTLIGLFRDLRGVITSATVTREYELVFAWLTPNRIHLLSAVPEAWCVSYCKITCYRFKA
jgi:hypothetical protein